MESIVEHTIIQNKCRKTRHRTPTGQRNIQPDNQHKTTDNFTKIKNNAEQQLHIRISSEYFGETRYKVQE
jgi:hypothetical protein